MPSPSASPISSGSAGISSGDSSAITVTSSTPARRAARATSSVVVMARRASSRDGPRAERASARSAARRPQRGPRRVERDVATTDHHDPLTQLHVEALVDVEQVLDGPQHAVEVVTGKVEVACPARTHGQEQRRRADRAGRRSSRRSPRGSPVCDVHPQLQDRGDLAGDDLTRQPVLGDAEHHHPAEPVVGFVDGHRMTGEAQVVGGGETGGAAADHPDRRALGRGHRPVGLVPRRSRREALHAEALGDEALQRPDRDRRVHRAAPAGRLARSRADAAADRGERVGRAGDQVGVAVPACRRSR